MFDSVGWWGTSRASLDSSDGFSAPETIHNNGKSWMNATIAARLNSTSCFTRRVRRALALAVGEVKATSLGDLEGDAGQDDQQQRVPAGHRGGVAELAGLERLLVDV